MVAGIYVARYLQPESYGMLNYAISFVGILSAFSALGVNRILVRELALAPEKRDEIMGTCFILKFVGAIFLFLIMSVVLVLMGNTPLTNTLIVIIAAAEMFKALDVIDSFYQAKVLSKNVARVQIIVNLVGNLLKVALIFMQAPLVWFAAVTALNSLFNGMGFLYTYWRKDGNPLRWVFRKDLAFSFLRESWPITLQGLALQTQAKIDQVMLGKMISNYEVGQYSVAMRMIEIFTFIPTILVGTFAPAVTKAKAISQKLYFDRIVNFYRLMFVLFLAISIPIFFLGERLVVLLYGVEYRAAGFLLSLFSIRLLFANIGSGKSLYVVNESLFRNSLLNAVVGAITNITVNYFLIPIYGSIGALFATIISFTVNVFVVDSFFAKTRVHQKLIFRGIFTFWKLNKIT
jgi:O-antigen/teichoic acid export membrane protein